MRRRRLPAVVGLVLVLAAGLAACGGSDESPSEGTAAEPAAPATSGAAPASAPPAGQSAEEAQLEDGRHPVVVQQVDVAGRTVTFDLVQWFEGDAAARAAAEDGEESPPPNDYYIRNVNPRLRTLPVAGGARLTLARLTVGQGGGNAAPVSRSTWPPSPPMAATTSSGPPCRAVGSNGWRSSTSPDRGRVPATAPRMLY